METKITIRIIDGKYTVEVKLPDKDLFILRGIYNQSTDPKVSVGIGIRDSSFAMIANVLNELR